MKDKQDVMAQYAEMQAYLPIAFKHEANHDTYLEQLEVNFVKCVNSDAFQFAYFCAYLTFMSFINYSAWKIAKTLPTRYLDAMIGLKPYKREDVVKLKDVETLDVYSFGLMAEKDVIEIFGLVDYETGNLKNFINDRNRIAHASGEFNVVTVDDLSVVLHAILNEMRTLDNAIRELYTSKFVSIMQDLVADKYTTEEEYESAIDDLIFQSEISYKELEYFSSFTYKKYIGEDTPGKISKAKTVKAKIARVYKDLYEEGFEAG